MSLFNEVHSYLNEIEDDARKLPDGLSLDQRIALAQAWALLSVSQELSDLNPRNTITRNVGGKPQ